MIHKEILYALSTKKKPTNNDTGPKKTNTAGLFGTFFHCGICTTDNTQLPDFAEVDMLKEYSVEGVVNRVQELKIETSSQFLSPPPPNAYRHAAPCNVVQHSESICGYSTMTHSLADNLVVRDDVEGVRGNALTTKHLNLTVQMPSHEQMSGADYVSLGLGSKETFSASGSASLSFMSVVGKGSSMEASELDTTQTQSQSFSYMSSRDGTTFTSAPSEDSEYTLTDGSSSLPSSALSFADDSFTCASSSLQENYSMAYETSLSGSSSSAIYYE